MLQGLDLRPNKSDSFCHPKMIRWSHRLSELAREKKHRTGYEDAKFKGCRTAKMSFSHCVRQIWSTKCFFYFEAGWALRPKKNGNSCDNAVSYSIRTLYKANTSYSHPESITLLFYRFYRFYRFHRFYRFYRLYRFYRFYCLYRFYRFYRFTVSFCIFLRFYRFTVLRFYRFTARPGAGNPVNKRHVLDHHSLFCLSFFYITCIFCQEPGLVALRGWLGRHLGGRGARAATAPAVQSKPGAAVAPTAPISSSAEIGQTTICCRKILLWGLSWMENTWESWRYFKIFIQNGR